MNYLGFSEDEEDKTPAELEQKKAELAKLLAPLGTKQMEGVLNHLKKVYVDRQIVRGTDTQFEAGIRQGEANVVLDLLMIVEEMHNG